MECEINKVMQNMLEINNTKVTLGAYTFCSDTLGLSNEIIWYYILII